MYRATREHRKEGRVCRLQKDMVPKGSEIAKNSTRGKPVTMGLARVQAEGVLFEAATLRFIQVLANCLHAHDDTKSGISAVRDSTKQSQQSQGGYA